MIYIQTFTDYTVYVENSPPDKVTLIPGLLGTCKQIYKEAIHLLYQHAMFCIGTPFSTTSGRWLCGLPTDKLDETRHIYVPLGLALQEEKGNVSVDRRKDDAGLEIAWNIFNRFRTERPNVQRTIMQFSGRLGDEEISVDASILGDRPPYGILAYELEE